MNKKLTKNDIGMAMTLVKMFAYANDIRNKFLFFFLSFLSHQYKTITNKLPNNAKTAIEIAIEPKVTSKGSIVSPKTSIFPLANIKHD